MTEVKMPVASREHQGEQIYCAEQINIPVTLPSILKDYAKAAIRTQPYDLLSWTAAYFRALAHGELPPVKERLEYPPYVHSSGITPRFLKILLNQYRHEDNRQNIDVTEKKTPRTKNVKLESLLIRWRGMALKDTSLYQILMTGRLLESSEHTEVCDLYRFLATACGLMGNNMFETMTYICELFTKEPDGGSAMIPLRIFMNLYEYLAELDCSGSQSILAPGQINFERPLEKDEASLIRSSHSSLSPSAIFSSSITSEISSTVKETQAVRCQSIDHSLKDTDTEESFCSSEVSCDTGENEIAGPDGTSREQSRNNAIITEGASARKPCGCHVSRRQKTSARRREKARQKEEKTQLESTSESSRYDSERSFKSKVPESSAERVSMGETEVTRVQEEELGRRRDVEMHSRTAEKVRLTVDDDETKTTAKSRPSLVSSTSSARDGASSSSPSKSHVAGASETAIPEATMSQEFERIDEILEARTTELPREAGGADFVNVENSPISNDPAEDIPGDGEDLTTPRNINAERFTVDSPTEGTNGEDGNVLRESLEYDEPSANDENDLFIPSQESHFQEKKNESYSSMEHNVGEDEGIAGEEKIQLDREDYVGVESIEENESVEHEESEDMAKYQTIGLENILEGICECLETTKDANDLLKSASDSVGQPSETSPISQRLDLVTEFIERMRVTECPNGSYILPEVPGIGPPVSPETVTAVGLWLTECSRRQQGQVGPRNFRHFMCPNLDGKPRYEDYIKIKNSSCPGNNSSVGE